MVSNQFQKTYDHGRIAFKAVIAIWNEVDNPCHMAISAPTKDDLVRVWKKVTGLDLIEDRVQDVVIIRDL